MLVMFDFNCGQHIFCLFAFYFSFFVGHIGFSSLVNRRFQVFGQLQVLYQVHKLLHRDCIIVNTKGCEENVGLFFCITAFVVRSFLQTLLHIQCRRRLYAVVASFWWASRISRRISIKSSEITWPKYSSSCTCASSSVRRYRSFSVSPCCISTIWRTACSTAFISLIRISAIRST